MTNKEAIEIIKDVKEDADYGWEIDMRCEYGERFLDACDMAIEALGCVNSSAFKDGYEKGKEDAYKNRKNADACRGCAFDDCELWQYPCRMCARNLNDYWRPKK